MKKIYLLISAALVALTSVAAPKFANQPIELNADAEFRAEQVKYEAQKAIENGEVAPTRSWTDPNGTVWSAFMVNQGGLWSMVGDGTYTVEDFPVYWVSVNITSLKEDQSGYNNYYSLDLCWPACVCWYRDAEGYLDLEAAYDALGDAMWDPTPLEWFNDQSIFTMIEAGYVNYIGILHPDTVNTTCMYNGVDGYTFTDDTTIYFANFDAEINWLDITLNGKLTGNGTRNVAMAYSGETTVLGLVVGAENEVEVGQVHIFDCGDIDYDSEWAFVYVEEFEPVRRYQVCFTSSDFAYMDPETGEIFNDVYDSTTTPEGPGAYVNPEGEYFSFWGTFFAKEGKEKPYGKWTGPEWWKQDAAGNVITVPEAYKLILGGYTLDISKQDGTWVVYGDFYRSPDQDSAEMVIGDKNVGMNFTWVDRFGENWTAAYKGDIFFHNNPEDFIDYVMLPAVGDEELVGIESVAAEKINVKVVGNSIVAPEGAEVYNLNGVRVNANELSNGLYIVKVGKNAVKVVL